MTLLREGGFRGGQMNRKGGPCSRRALDRQPAAMTVENVFDQRQAETGTALVAALAHIDPVEALGESRQMFRRDTRAVISHADLHFRFAFGRFSGSQRNIDTLAGRTSSSRSPSTVCALAASTLTVTPRSRASVCRASATWRTIGTRSTGLSG